MGTRPNMCRADSDVLKSLSAFYEALPASRWAACNRTGTIPNPVVVRTRQRHRAGAIFRYLVYQVVSKGAEAVLMRGNRVATQIDGVEGIGVPSPFEIDAVGRALAWEVSADIATQVADGQWFVLDHDRDTLYLLDSRKFRGSFSLSPASDDLLISKIYSRRSGQTRPVGKDMTEILKEAQEAKERWQQVVSRGRSI